MTATTAPELARRTQAEVESQPETSEPRHRAGRRVATAAPSATARCRRERARCRLRHLLLHPRQLRPPPAAARPGPHPHRHRHRTRRRRRLRRGDPAVPLGHGQRPGPGRPRVVPAHPHDRDHRHPGSPITEAVHETIVMDFADEHSVVADPLRHLRADPAGAPPSATSVPACRTWPAPPWPSRSSPTRPTTTTIVFLGTGWARGLAEEAALKLREAARLWTEVVREPRIPALARSPAPPRAASCERSAAPADVVESRRRDRGHAPRRDRRPAGRAGPGAPPGRRLRPLSGPGVRQPRAPVPFGRRGVAVPFVQYAHRRARPRGPVRPAGARGRRRPGACSPARSSRSGWPPSTERASRPSCAGGSEIRS